ncbi:MAG: non-specific lipid-transfer protein-like [Bradyrhizobium sp.]|nr:non-specific lipid-transfer protein-like [Bradyrhizobium sp.]
MADVVVVGVGMIKFGRFPDRSLESLGAEAALLALEDAGLTIHDMQALYSGNVYERMLGQRVLREIGQTGIGVVNCSNACASGATAFREGWVAIKAGIHDVVLIVGAEKMPKGMLGGGAVGSGDRLSPEGLAGSATNPSLFAHMGMEHARKYGTTPEQFARVSVKNHHHSTFNPKAMYQIETPLDVVMSAEMISFPNTKLMCSVNVDGSAAAILCSEAKARQLGLMSRAVRVRGSALASDPWSERNLSMTDFNAVTKLASAAAYESAGVGPDEIDLVELHDCFATAELVHYENLGLCAEGEAGALIDSGDVALGGRVPVNVSGGLLSKGHPLGATGIANVYEIATHLRGEAGRRQVEGAKIGMTHVVGRGSACAVHILERA